MSDTLIDLGVKLLTALALVGALCFMVFAFMGSAFVLWVILGYVLDTFQAVFR